MNNRYISPPWYTLRNQIACTFGDNSHIKVSELGETSSASYTLAIYARDLTSAISTKAILPPTYKFGNIIVDVNVFYQNTLLNTVSKTKNSQPENIALLFNNALKYNNLFKNVFLPKQNPYFKVPDVAIIIKKSIVQFYNDDLSDFYFNYNEIASNVFNNICLLTFNNVQVKFYTENQRCKL